MLIRGAVNGAVHLAGGIAMGVLAVFAAKTLMDLYSGRRDSAGDVYGKTAAEYEKAPAAEPPPASSEGEGLGPGQGI